MHAIHVHSMFYAQSLWNDNLSINYYYFCTSRLLSPKAHSSIYILDCMQETAETSKTGMDMGKTYQDGTQ